MSKIISSRKKYVPVKDLKVYPSNKETIEVIPDDGEWVDPRKEGLFWSEEDFNFDFDKLLGTVKFPELNKGERIEMNLQFEFGIK